MGFRLFRRVRIAPGLSLNIGKGGASLSAGIRGARVTLGARGARGTVGLPGTGLSYSATTKGGRRRGSAEAPENAQPPASSDTARTLKGCAVALLLLLAVSAIGALFGGAPR